jgi:ribosome maturation factor RimP
LEIKWALPYLCPGKRSKEGNDNVPFFFYLNGKMENQRSEIESIIAELLQEDPSSFLVEVKITAGNNVKVFIDTDQGANIDKLVKMNRGLYKRIEESGIFPGNDFALEVSSPGLDEPLKSTRQYIKNIGRDVEVILKDGQKMEGKLLGAKDDEIVVEELKGKKKEPAQHNIPIENIKHTKIQIKI